MATEIRKNSKKLNFFVLQVIHSNSYYINILKYIGVYLEESLLEYT